MQEALDVTGLSGVTVTLSIPRGARVAQNTLNPRVGVTGGIPGPVLPGSVEPWDDHLGESVRARLSGTKNVVLTTGRVGSGFTPDSFLTGRSCSQAAGSGRPCPLRRAT